MECHARLRTLRRCAPLLAAAVGLWGCAWTANAPLATVESVDLQRYAGDWYEIAKLPNVFQSSCAADTVARAAANADKALIVNASVFDIFEGKDIPAGKKSVAVAVTIQPKDATLTEAEIDAQAKKIVANVTKQTGGTLRG